MITVGTLFLVNQGYLLTHHSGGDQTSSAIANLTDLVKQLKASIQGQMKPPIIVQAPPPPPPHTHLNFVVPPRELPVSPLLPFRTGEQPALDVGFTVSGDFPLHDRNDYVKILVVSHAESQKEVFQRHRKELRLLSPSTGATFNPHTGDFVYHTYLGSTTYR